MIYKCELWEFAPWDRCNDAHNCSMHFAVCNIHCAIFINVILRKPTVAMFTRTEIML